MMATLGIGPARGRNFTAEEDVPNGPAVCIISHEMWQTRFGGRAEIVGNAITLDGQAWQVVGVTPPRLTAPFAQVQVFAPRVFEVTGLTSAQVQNGASYMQPIARLAPGISLDQARTELRTISVSYRKRFAHRLDAANMTEAQMFVTTLVGNLEPTFYTLLAAVSFVLLIACANVASLFIGRLVARQREIALRQSLGATRARVVRQFLIESLVFSTLAGALGALFAIWPISLIQSLVSAQLPPNTELTLSWRALGFTCAITAATALLVGLAPALQASGTSVVDALKDWARGSSSERGGRLRSALIVAEVALSVVLLVGSSLLLVSFVKLRRISPGFEPGGAAAGFVGVSTNRYKTPTQQADFFNQVIERLRARPHVIGAAAASAVPLSGAGVRSPYAIAGRPVLPLPQRALANLAVVSEDYFAVMRIAFLEGRAFTATDRQGAPGVCIVNESLARRLFPGESAIGKVLLRGRDAELRNEIVGIIRDVKSAGLNLPAPDEIYYPMRQLGRPGMAIIARTDGDPAALQSVLRIAVAEVDRNQPISFFSTLESTVSQSLGVQRIVAALTAVFAALAVLMSAVGLYSVLAYSVSQRTSEIGIRMALGARPAQVIVMIMHSGFRLVSLGLAVGLAAAAVSARLIQKLLFGVEPLDPTVYGAVAILFTAVAALACLVPSIRAARIDPLAALRTD